MVRGDADLLVLATVFQLGAVLVLAKPSEMHGPPGLSPFLRPVQAFKLRGRDADEPRRVAGLDKGIQAESDPRPAGVLAERGSRGGGFATAGRQCRVSPHGAAVSTRRSQRRRALRSPEI